MPKGSKGLDHDNFFLLGDNADLAMAERVEAALMDSPTHRDNILEPAFTRLAIGVAADASGRVALAQIFRAG